MTNLFSELPPDHVPIGTPASVLTIGAHPDDAEFGAGATLSRWADAGAVITMCVVTDGSKGSWDTNEEADSLIQRRIDEQARAAEVMGADRCLHLGHVDGELEYSIELRRQLAVIIREIRPDVVLTHDPWQRYQLHPDHRATGRAACDAVVDAREPRALVDSGVEAHRPEMLLLWSADEADHAEPVDDHWFARKVDALLCHASQATTTMGDATTSVEARKSFENRLRSWQDAQGAALGVGTAEVFKRIDP